MGIQLRHLAALRAVLAEGSFNQAASKLGYTQSAVSQQISALERIIGHRLLNRQVGSNKVTLTPAGERFLAYANELLDGLLAAEADLASLEAGAERLAIGVYESVGVRIMPDVLPGFSASWPGVNVQLVEGWTDEELLGQLRLGALDLAFATTPIDPNTFAWVDLMSDPIVLVVPAGSELAAKRFVRPVDLKGSPLIGYRKCKSSDLVSDYLRRHGLRPRFVHVADENLLIQALVRAGGGAALLPKLAVDTRDEGIRTLELAPPGIARTIALAWLQNREQSLAAISFIETVKKFCARQVGADPGDTSSSVGG